MASYYDAERRASRYELPLKLPASYLLQRIGQYDGNF